MTLFWILDDNYFPARFLFVARDIYTNVHMYIDVYIIACVPISDEKYSVEHDIMQIQYLVHSFLSTALSLQLMAGD